MRCFILCVVLAASRVAAAGGGYFSESFGAAGFNGGLRAYGEGAFKFQIGAGIWSGPWTFEIVGGAMMDPDWFAIDCYGEECDSGPNNHGSIGFFGVDFKKRWQVLWTKWRGLNAQVTLHGGPRYYVGEDALTGYQGVGVSGGAGIEGNIWVLGYFIDAGADIMALHMAVDNVSGSSPYLMFGARMGWL